MAGCSIEFKADIVAAYKMPIGIELERPGTVAGKASINPEIRILAISAAFRITDAALIDAKAPLSGGLIKC